MNNRISEAITRFNSVKKDESADRIFDFGKQLLEQLQSSPITTLTEDQLEEQYDAIIMGTVLCFLTAHIHNHRYTDLNYLGLKKEYSITLHDIYKMNQIKTEPKTLKEPATFELCQKIISIGHKVLNGNSLLSFNRSMFTEDSRFGKMISDLIPEDRLKKYDKKYTEMLEHKELYLTAYKDQESQHTRRLFLGKALAVIAAFIPPLSLIFTLPGFRHQPLGMRIFLCTFFAIFPIGPGVISWIIVNAREKEKKQQDPIVKSVWDLDRFMINKGNSKFIHSSLPNSVKNLAKKEELEAIKQTKKTKVVYKEGNNIAIYWDREQYSRSVTLYHDLASFKVSHQTSVATVEALENKYRPRSQHV